MLCRLQKELLTVQAARGAISSSAHTYRLRIFKERVLLLYCGLPLRKQMGSGVLDAAAASETKIMEDSATPCKVRRHLFRAVHYNYRKNPPRAGCRTRRAPLGLVAGIGFEPMTFGL